MKTLISKKYTRVFSSALLAGLMGFAGLGVAMQATAQDVSDKAIRIGGSSGKTLKVTFNPIKTSFRVGEPIRFRVRGNQTFFLYVYTVDKDSGKAILLLPNPKQDGNKYRGHRSQLVPNRNVEFYADEPGKERIIMVASTKYIDVENRYQKSGDFFTGDAAGIEEAFASKGIHIRGPGSRHDSKTVVKEFSINIKGSSRRGRDISDVGDTPAPFISANRTYYRIGQKVRITYGATGSGWVRVYVVEPGGAYSLIKTKRVTGDKYYKLTAKAEEPGGRHLLVAVYSKSKELADDSFESKTLGSLLADTSAKGLSVPGVPRTRGKTAMAVYPIRIETEDD